MFTLTMMKVAYGAQKQQPYLEEFEPLPPVEPVTHTLLEVNEVVITLDIRKLVQAYNT